MGEQDPANLTQLLRNWGAGDREALDRLVPLVYAELRRLSRHYLQRGPHRTLQTTALINEAFARLIDQDGISWESHAHFFGIAARTMRNIVVDHAREATAAKRGGGQRELLFDDARYMVNEKKGWGLVALDEGPRGAGGNRPAVEPARRAALLCRHDGRGDRGGSRRVTEDRQTGLENREDLAIATLRQARSAKRATLTQVSLFDALVSQ